MSASGSGGVLFLLQDRNTTAFEERVDRRIDYTAAIDRSIPIDASAPCLVVTPSNGIVAVGQILRSQSFTTVDRRVRLTHIQMVGPWPIPRISRNMPPSLVRWLEPTTATHQLPPKTWAAVIQAIRALDEDAAQFLGTVGRRAVSATETHVQREERDAVLLCMDMAGLERSHVGGLPLQTGAHFLEGAEAIGLLEGRMVDHDAYAGLPGWTRNIDPPHAYGFADAEGRRLTVMNVGGDRPETALGVDLIYWRQEPNAFVLVQYKRLLKEGSTWRYRPVSDQNFQKEADRMHQVMKAMGELPASAERHSDYRLMANPFFFKFCGAVQSRRRPDELMTGMYVPLRLWELLEADGMLTGPKGGVSISRENASRWLSNTLFVELVGDAWLGSAGNASKYIAELVKSSLGMGKAVVVGIEHPGRLRRGRAFAADPFA